MRKLAISLAAAGTALGLAAPASAQYNSQQAYGYRYAQPAYGYGYQPSYAPRAYGYAQPAYGYGYQPAYAPRSYGYGQSAYGYAPRGYGYNSGAIVQRLDYRISGIRAQIRGLQARGMLRWNKARTLDRQALSLQRAVHASAWNGIGGYEARSLELRTARLEQQVRYASLRQRYAPRYGNRYAPRYAGYGW